MQKGRGRRASCFAVVEVHLLPGLGSSSLPVCLFTVCNDEPHLQPSSPQPSGRSVPNIELKAATDRRQALAKTTEASLARHLPSH